MFKPNRFTWYNSASGPVVVSLIINMNENLASDTDEGQAFPPYLPAPTNIHAPRKTNYFHGLE